MILSSTLTMNLVLTAQLEIEINQTFPIVPRMRWLTFAVVRFQRSVLQADTIVVSCGLANFAQSSWSAHRRHGFWGTHEGLHTKEDNDKVVRSFKDNYPEMCDGRSIWAIDCRKFDDPDNDRSLVKHIGQNPRITKSFWNPRITTRCTVVCMTACIGSSRAETS